MLVNQRSLMIITNFWQKFWIFKKDSEVGTYLIFSVDLWIFTACLYTYWGGRHGCDRMVIGFTTTYSISAYHHWCCEFKSRLPSCDQVCQWLATCRWFSPSPPVSSTNKTDRHDITEILLKMALNTIKQTNKHTILKI